MPGPFKNITDQDLFMWSASLCVNSPNSHRMNLAVFWKNLCLPFLCCLHTANIYYLPFSLTATSTLTVPPGNTPDPSWHNNIIPENKNTLPAHHSPRFQYIFYNGNDKAVSKQPTILKASIQLLVNLSNFFSYCNFSCSGDQPGSKLLLGRFHKDLFSSLESYLNVGVGKAFSTGKAWDVFRMLEQLKKDFAFKLGMHEFWMKTRAFDKFEEMDLEITK